MTACPACGQRVPDGARFCSSCGATLEARATNREERRVVSILFVDLVGSTARADRADPEDVRDVLQAYHEQVRSQIERFGGTVEKFIGDAVMAVFGAPVAHTDDPERAVRAGLRALAAVEEMGHRSPGPGLAARAAVTTGEAVVSLGQAHARGEPLALGDVVNTAARLQAAAPAGGLVVDEETHLAVRDAVRCEELTAITAPGKAAPVPAWLVLETLAGPSERRIRGTPLVGRDRELALLASVWERATHEHRPHLVTVIGPAGIGKSRLAAEAALTVVATGGRVISGRCLPYDAGDVYGAFAQQVRELAGIADEDPPATARDRLVELVDRLFPESERRDVVRSLSLLLGLGLDAPVDEQLLLMYSARRLVERLGAEQPTLLVLEDIQWADDALLALITYVAAHARSTAVVVLALARPELVDTRPTWGSGLHAQSTLTLEPLSEADAATIVARQAAVSLSEEAVRRVVATAGGNPLFLEELAAAVAERPGLDAGLPTTVRAAIAGRLDALPGDHRDALLAASVVGASFWVGTLQALGQPAHVGRVLDTLEARDLIRREPVSRVKGDIEFTFKHALIREVCYGILPRAERRRAHASVARYIEQASGDHDRELAWLLAHHWEQAGEPARAVDYLLLAADRAGEAMAEADAMSMYAHAESLATDDPGRLRIRLLRALARARFEDFEPAYAELGELLPQLEGRELVEAMLTAAQAAHWTERTAETLRLADEAERLAQSVGAVELVAPAMARRSQGLAMRGEEGDLDRAVEVGEEALRQWHPGVRTNDLAEHEHLLADQYYWTGRYRRALELAGTARAQAVDPSSIEARLRAASIEGVMLTTTGRYEEAYARFDDVIALGRELGRPVRVMLNYSTLACREVFDLDEARRRSEEALSQQGRNTSFHMPWMNAAVDLVHVDVLAGEMGSADARWRSLWEEVLATPAWERWLLGSKLAALRAQMMLTLDGPEAAAEWATRALGMARSVSRVKYEIVARRVLGRALLVLGRAEEAVGELEAASSAAEALGSPAGRWPAHADLATALVHAGRDAEAETQTRIAAAIVTEVADGLSSARRQRFLAAPPVVAALSPG